MKKSIGQELYEALLHDIEEYFCKGFNRTPRDAAAEIMEIYMNPPSFLRAPKK